MKNIYELMNEIKTDTEEYPQEEFSEFEAKKWNKKLSKEAAKKEKVCIHRSMRSYLYGTAGGRAVQGTGKSGNELSHRFLERMAGYGYYR